jgi:CRISPR/Cas system-associated exonuclease Cas4 (RecB family)
MFAELLLGAAQLGLRTDEAYRPRPSMAGPERCERQMVYKARGVEELAVSSRLAVVFKDGVAHEQVTLDILKTTLFDVHSEQLPIDLHGVLDWLEGQPPYRCSVCTAAQRQPVLIPATTLHGHIDALARDLFAIDRLIEHKGFVSHIFKRLWDQDKEPLDNFTQAVLYFRGLKEKGLAVDEGALLIKNKDTGAYLEFELRYDYEQDILSVPVMTRSPHEREEINRSYQGLFRATIEKFRRVNVHTVTETLPDRLKDPNDVRCDYCPFQDICWEGFVRPPLTEHIALPAPLVPLAYEWIQLDRELKPKNKRAEELKETLMSGLQKLHAESATTETDVLKLVSSTQERLDQKALPLSLKKVYSKSFPIMKLQHVRRFPEPDQVAKKRSPTRPSRPHESAA